MLKPFFWFVLFTALYIFRPQSRWRNKFKWAAIIVFVFFSNSVIFSEFCRLWEVPGQHSSNFEKHDVAIVLGGMAEYNSDINELSFRRQGDRLMKAITLYKTNKVSKILISGDNGYLTDRGLHEAKQAKALLIQWGIPKQDILTEEKSVNTYENAKYSVQLLKNKYPELNKVILVTSGIHMRRARACFAKQGLVCTPCSTDLYANQSRNYYWDQYFIPSLDNFIQWNKLLKESFGYMAYDMIGYI